MKYKVEFKKIKNDHQRLRDDVIVGMTFALPSEGAQFVMFAESRDKTLPPGSMRQVNTSIVKEVQKTSEDVYLLQTQSGSTYQVTVLK